MVGLKYKWIDFISAGTWFKSHILVVVANIMYVVYRVYCVPFMTSGGDRKQVGEGKPESDLCLLQSRSLSGAV